MASRTPGDDGIGPDLDLAAIALPPHLGVRLAAFYDLDDRPATAAEWVAVMERHVVDEVADPDPETVLCTAPNGDHAVAVGGEERSFVCVLDPMALAFFRGEPATVHSTTPLDRTDVTIDIAADGVTARPSGAVVSLGAGHGVADVEPTPGAAYEQLCRYTHAFASTDEYERWDATVDAATTDLSIAHGAALSRALARTVAG